MKRIGKCQRDCGADEDLVRQSGHTGHNSPDKQKNLRKTKQAYLGRETEEGTTGISFVRKRTEKRSGAPGKTETGKTGKQGRRCDAKRQIRTGETEVWTSATFAVSSRFGIWHRQPVAVFRTKTKAVCRKCFLQRRMPSTEKRTGVETGCHRP